MSDDLEKDISPVLRELADRVQGLRTPNEQSLTQATFELAKEVYERLEYDKSPEYAEAFMRRYVRLLDYARTATRGRFFGWFFTAKDTARYLRHLADMLGVQKRKPEGRKKRKRVKRPKLTKKQQALLDYLNKGRTQAQAAEHFRVTPGAISQRRRRIREKADEFKKATGRSIDFHKTGSLRNDYGSTGKSGGRTRRQRKV